MVVVLQGTFEPDVGSITIISVYWRGATWVLHDMPKPAGQKAMQLIEDWMDLKFEEAHDLVPIPAGDCNS